MKFKKSWIFWIRYYGATIIGTGLSIYFFNDRLNISLFSIFPAAYISICIFEAWFFPSQFRYNHRYAFLPTRSRFIIGDISTSGLRIRFRKKEGFSIENTPTYGYNCPEDHFASKVFLLTLSIFIPFALFFSAIAKILIGFCLLIPPLATLIYGIFVQKKETDMHNSKLKQQLKIQQEREELGKWK